jgi:hypothetical protein
MIDGRLGQVTIDNNYKHYNIHAKEISVISDNLLKTKAL